MSDKSILFLEKLITKSFKFLETRFSPLYSLFNFTPRFTSLDFTPRLSKNLNYFSQKLHLMLAQVLACVSRNVNTVMLYCQA